MFTVLLLAGIEKVVNLAIVTDPITQAGLQPLSGKVLRLVMAEPAIEFDTIFNDDHIRFEPMTVDVFEPKGSAVVSKPDCIVKVDNPVHLLNLMGDPQGNLPIEGDYKVLMQVKQLVAGFDPDIIGKLQPLIGLPMASQLSNLLANLKGTIAVPAKEMFADIANIREWKANDASTDTNAGNELKQQLLKLRADIEREQARLDAIKQQQAALLEK